MPSAAQTKSEVDAAKNALDLKIYQATTDALVAQREAEIRKATAQADRAELLARLPPTDSKALPGTVDSDAFGAAGLAKGKGLRRVAPVPFDVNEPDGFVQQVVQRFQFFRAHRLAA